MARDRSPSPHSFARLAALFACVTSLSVLLSARQAGGPSGAEPSAAQAPRTPTLPQRLTDRQFWNLSESLSEPGGYFRSENLVSNEHTFQYVIPELRRRVKPGGVYLGVAPDQNFTYIAAVQPAMAFIVDIRRGNLLQHLMYKAIFELSKDRADFVSLLFSKKRPERLGPSSSATEIFAAFDQVETSKELYAQNVAAIRTRLVKGHGFRLSDDDLEKLESIYFAFFWDGPGIRYSMGQGGRGFGTAFPTYEELMVQTDWEGVERGYLASDTNFRFVKTLEEKNLIVPVVGNFAGPKALRGVGRYARERGATITAFYVSNVEQYLRLERVWGSFCGNASRLPIDETSTFIRAGRGGRYSRGTALTAELAPIAVEVEGCDRRP